MRLSTIERALAGAVAASAVLMAAGCANVGTTSVNVNQIAARDLAASVTDPTTGTTEEMTDLGSFLFPEALGGQPWSLFHASDFALFLTDGVLSQAFLWNAANADYELSETRTISAGPITGTAAVTIAVAFFTSTDASGTGEQIAPLTSGAAPFSGVHSLTYNRQISGTFKNSLSGVGRQHSSKSAYTVTGLNGATPGFTITGMKTVSFTDSYPDGKSIAGTITETVNNVAVTAVLQSDGSYLVTATGTILADYSATITDANGTTTQVSRTATITLNGQQTVHIDMDGTEVDADLSTGEIE